MRLEALDCVEAEEEAFAGSTSTSSETPSSAFPPALIASPGTPVKRNGQSDAQMEGLVQSKNGSFTLADGRAIRPSAARLQLYRPRFPSFIAYVFCFAHETVRLFVAE